MGTYLSQSDSGDMSPSEANPCPTPPSADPNQTNDACNSTAPKKDEWRWENREQEKKEPSRESQPATEMGSGRTKFLQLMGQYGLTEEYYNLPVKYTHLQKLSRSGCEKWKSLPPYLELENIVATDIDMSQKKAEEKRYDFFLQWKVIKGLTATYKWLISALLKIKCRQDAERLCKMLKKSVRQSQLCIHTVTSATSHHAEYDAPSMQCSDAGVSSEDVAYQLEEGIKEISCRYASFVSCLYDRIDKKGVTVQQLYQFIINLPVFKSGNSGKRYALFADVKSKLQAAGTICAIFDILSDCSSFLNCEDCEELKYSHHLEAHIQGTKIESFLAANPKLHVYNKSTDEKIRIKFDLTLTSYFDELCNNKHRICTILGIYPSSLRLLSIKEGCVLGYFLFPAAIADIVFREFTLKQKEQFNALPAVLWIKYDGRKIYCRKDVPKNADSPPSSSDDEMEVQLKDSSDTIEELQVSCEGSGNTPITSTPAVSCLDPEVRTALDYQLQTNLEEILSRYSSFVSCVLDCLAGKKVTVEQLCHHLHCLSAFNSKTKDVPFVKGELEGASTLSDIFVILNTFTSFLDCEIYFSILDGFQITEDHEELMYRKHLKRYIHRHKASEFIFINARLKAIAGAESTAVDTESATELKVITDIESAAGDTESATELKAITDIESTAGDTESASELKAITDIESTTKSAHKLVLKFDIEETCKMAKVVDLKDAICSILGIIPSALTLIGIEEGCVVLTYRIPAHIADVIFSSEGRFSADMRRKFHALSVLWLRCSGYTYIFEDDELDAPSISHHGDSLTEELVVDQLRSGGSETEQESNFTALAAHGQHTNGSIESKPGTPFISSYDEDLVAAQQHSNDTEGKPDTPFISNHDDEDLVVAQQHNNDTENYDKNLTNNWMMQWLSSILKVIFPTKLMTLNLQSKV